MQAAFSIIRLSTFHLLLIVSEFLEDQFADLNSSVCIERTTLELGQVMLEAWQDDLLSLPKGMRAKVTMAFNMHNCQNKGII